MPFTRIVYMCQLCAAAEDKRLPVSRGWSIDSVEVDGLCPNHAKVAEFKAAQCDGCSFTFGEGCPLFQTFAFHKSTGLTPRQEAALILGACPVRDPRDPDEEAPEKTPEAGRVLALAAKNYRAAVTGK